VADKDKENPPAKKDAAKPGFDPKPVQLGGESLVDRVLPHMKKILVFMGITALVLTVIFTVRHFKEKSRQKTTAKLAKVLDVADWQVRAQGVEPDPKAKDPTHASPSARAAAILDAIAKQGSDAGTVYRASLLLQTGKVDDAIAAYRKAQRAKGLDGVLAREGLAIALETKALEEKDAAARQKGLEEALSVFKTMQPDEKGARFAYSLYHQGRVLGHLQKTDEAKAMLEKAKAAGGDNELPGLVDVHLASLGAT
jgi:tetratricopeptide (TPR) repeat protein